MLVSSDVHYLKPEPEIYRILFGRFGLDPEECFFIDDRQENIETGEALGMRGFCYRQDMVELKRAFYMAGVTFADHDGPDAAEKTEKTTPGP